MKVDLQVCYGLVLGACGLGWSLVLLNENTEMGNRGTFSGVIRAVTRRLADMVPREHRLLVWFRRKWTAGKQRNLDQEIFDGSMLLKNLAIVEKERAFSADYLYERLLENSRLLKPVYGEMLSLYRSGRDADAFEVLTRRCQTRAARNFSMVLAKVGQINPEALVEQMEVFQEMMSQQRITADMQKLQRSSLITTIMAACVVFVMLIDFAVVVVFLHTMDLVSAVF